MKTITGPKDPGMYHITCNNDVCGAVLEVSKKDMRLQADDRDGKAYVLLCPHCEKETWIDATALQRFAMVKVEKS